MKRTTVEEYDGEGKLVKKTVTEEQSWYPYWCACTCGITYCPLHTPYKGPIWATITTRGTAPSAQIYSNAGANQ